MLSMASKFEQTECIYLLPCPTLGLRIVLNKYQIILIVMSGCEYLFFNVFLKVTSRYLRIRPIGDHLIGMSYTT